MPAEGVGKVTHRLSLPACCPVSGNPREGSWIEITYRPREWVLEVASLLVYVRSFIGGKGEVRSMEGMIVRIAEDVARAVGVRVAVRAEMSLWPEQEMCLEVRR